MIERYAYPADGEFFADGSILAGMNVILEPLKGWAEDKNLGPWGFETQGDKYGYINNPRWAYPATPQHIPCGYWRKYEVIATDRVIVGPEFAVVGDWRHAIMSPDGSCITLLCGSGNAPDISGIYSSNDYGLTWRFHRVVNMRGTVQYLAGVSRGMSYDGRYQLVCGDTSVFISRDYGVTWIEYSGMLNAISSLNFQHVFVSVNGAVMMVVGTSGLFYYSSTFGTLWGARDLGAAFHFGASPRGDIIVGNNGTGDPRVSYDFGENWNVFTGVNRPTSAVQGGYHYFIGEDLSISMMGAGNAGPWFHSNISNLNNAWVRHSITSCIAAASRDSKYRVATGYVNPNAIWMANNYGNDLVAVPIENIIPPNASTAHAIQMSDDGKHIIRSSPGQNGVYVSNDYGVTFTSKLGQQTPTRIVASAIAVSADGQYMVAGEIGATGRVWFSSNYGVDWEYRMTHTERIRRDLTTEKYPYAVWNTP